jgi:hypothetical protein
MKTRNILFDALKIEDEDMIDPFGNHALLTEEEVYDPDKNTDEEIYDLETNDWE